MLNITEEKYKKVKEKAFNHFLKKVNGFQKYEYVSVIPVWKVTDKGPQLYLDNESDF